MRGASLKPAYSGITVPLTSRVTGAKNAVTCPVPTPRYRWQFSGSSAEVQILGNLKREHAIVCARVHERQKIYESVLVQQADADARPKDVNAFLMGQVRRAWLFPVGKFHRKEEGTLPQGG